VKRLSLIFVLLLFCIGCSLSDKEIEFSLTKVKEEDGSVLGPTQNQFTTDDESLYFSSPLSGKTGRYVIMIEKGGNLIDLYTETFDVTPDWTGVIYPFIIPSEEGSYTLKVFSQKDELLMGKGDFTVVKGNNK
jgi:hypothetical protein